MNGDSTFTSWPVQYLGQYSKKTKKMGRALQGSCGLRLSEGATLRQSNQIPNDGRQSVGRRAVSCINGID